MSASSWASSNPSVCLLAEFASAASFQCFIVRGCPVIGDSRSGSKEILVQEELEEQPEEAGKELAEEAEEVEQPEEAGKELVEEVKE